MPVVKPDRFQPILLSSPPLEVSSEQLMYIEEILRTACSDSRFAQKAFVAITYVLTHGNDVVPEVSSISPNTAVAGSGVTPVNVMGKNFTSDSKVMVAGVEKPTTFMSETELSVSVDPIVPGEVQVAVLSGAYLSNSLPFTVTSARSESHSMKSNETGSTKYEEKVPMGADSEYHEKRLKERK